MSNSKYALAMYDVRGKQEYIFKTNKLKEIVREDPVLSEIVLKNTYSHRQKNI